MNQKEINATGNSLDLSGSDIETLPDGVSIQFQLNLTDCRNLRRLPDGLKAGSLVLAGCTSLERLPEGMEVSFLDISGCRQLTDWPTTGKLEAGRLRARDCTGLTSLPTWLTSIAQLDLRGCENIRELPESLVVASWLDLAGTGIQRLPAAMADVALRWKGVPIDERIAFRPDEISADEVLPQRNAELRRVLLERVGFERFLSDVDAEVLNEDTDPGGPRKLMRVPMGDDDEPLVCVSVFCPSTQRQYIIRVPPTITTCHAAIAWTAGFDDPSLYRPLIET